MNSLNRSESRFRWAEIMLTVMVSAVTTAVTVAWSMSATITAVQKDINALKDTQAAQTATISNLSSQASLQGTQIAVSDANYKNILIWLAEIKEELRKRR